jgi:pyruvate dehydrogenase E1 component alpha subunit
MEVAARPDVEGSDPHVTSGQRLEVLDIDGSLRPGTEAPLSDDETLTALRWMMLSRAVDARATSLQRQGRMGTFSAVRGQEASVVGSSSALDPARDWIVQQYRELPAMARHGVPLDQFLLYWMGNPAGGRIPDGVNVLPVQIALAAQLPHATGLAWGLALQGSDAAVMTYFGDGASSEGDFHEALNLAGVVRAPVVFWLQNNGWAISTPRSQQTAAASFADRAAGYGIAGAVVDGNDLFAVSRVARDAVARARAGDGPTLVESQTYRMGAHNTADDPTRYMHQETLDEWEVLDPILRVQRYLAARGRWDPDAATSLQAEIDAEIDGAVERAEARGPADPAEVFAHVYADPPARQEAQRRAALGPDGEV